MRTAGWSTIRWGVPASPASGSRATPPIPAPRSSAPPGKGRRRRSPSTPTWSMKTSSARSPITGPPASSRSTACRERTSVAGAELDPPGELGFGPDVFRGDAQPARQLPAAHLHGAGAGGGDEGGRLRRIDADQDAALAAGRDGHVAADQEGEPAEHLLLGETGLALDQLTDALREDLVVRHTGDATTGWRQAQRQNSLDDGCRLCQGRWYDQRSRPAGPDRGVRRGGVDGPGGGAA